ncbi:MAG TPA: hypothetical protein VFU07_07150 [Candidatus Lumbricidophila sp.]|nr:hypothetical protein [Candidatus Lumbricidophila sp.]
MSTNTGTEAAGAEGAAEGSDNGEQQAKTFTQAELDQIVRDRLAQQAKNKFGDYDDLKAKAGAATTAEDRILALEKDLAATRTDALRARIAARFQISTEPGKNGSPSDAELFLTGTDETTLTAQAERLAQRVVDRKKQGNVAPNEGKTSTTGGKTSDIREFTKSLFESAD